MITKEILNKQANEVYRKLDSLYRQIEDIWSWAMEKGYHGLADVADKAQHQFVKDTSVMDVKNEIRDLLDDVYSAVEQHEKIKELPKLLDYMMAFDQIQADVKRWDKRLYPEDYKSNEG